MDLLMAFLGCDFKTMREKLLPVVMGIHYEPFRRAPTGASRGTAITNNADIWTGGGHTPYDAIMYEYLQFRGLTHNEFAGADLRLHLNLDYYDEQGKLQGHRPTMLARIFNRDGKLACIHRTYLFYERQLAPTSKPKDFTTVKKVTTPGREWSGGAIRLFDCSESKHLIVAEGIETALSVRARIYRGSGKLVPCWVGINANNMEKMGIPEHITNVLIGADNDLSYTGQAAAYKLANRLTVQNKKTVSVWVPEKAGTDFNDELRSKVTPLRAVS
jgi:putative DNA primase/helicase